MGLYVRNVSYAGCHAKQGTLADRIHDGRGAESDVEDTLDDWWSGVDHISTDSYDNSLEVYFEDNVEDVEATPQQQAAIWEMGFDRFWLNFKGGRHKDGTERAYISPELAARSQVMKPKEEL